MKKPINLAKVQGCFVGIAIGDALGMPVETMTSEQISEATSGRGIINFIDPINRKDWSKNSKAGDTTDDWQLTRAVANSLIRCSGKFDAYDCAWGHVDELALSTFGWGKTTQKAIEAIKRRERVPGRDPLLPAPAGKGCGNGIIMKIAPLAIAQYVRSGIDDDLWQHVKDLGEITHPDIYASIAAYAVAIAYQTVIASTATHLPSYFLFRNVLSAVEEVEKMEGKKEMEMSKRLKKLETVLDSAEKLRTTVGCGFHAIDTAAFTIGTFLRHPMDFEAGIIEAVNAGGDTDTNASVVGGLIGANMGINAIPSKWKNFGSSFNEPFALAEKFYTAIV